jgi:hypothetical protein
MGLRRLLDLRHHARAEARTREVCVHTLADLGTRVASKVPTHFGEGRG